MGALCVFVMIGADEYPCRVTHRREVDGIDAFDDEGLAVNDITGPNEPTGRRLGPLQGIITSIRIKRNRARRALDRLRSRSQDRRVDVGRGQNDLPNRGESVERAVS